MMEKEWSAEGEVLTTLGMKDGGREQVHGCRRQRGTVALEVEEPCLERCLPRQVMLLGIWQTKAGLGLWGQASQDGPCAFPGHGGGPSSKAGESLPEPGRVAFSGLPSWVGRDIHLPLFLP